MRGLRKRTLPSPGSRDGEELSLPREPGWLAVTRIAHWRLVHEDGAVLDVPFPHDEGEGEVVKIDKYQFVHYLNTAQLSLPERRLRPNAHFPSSWHYDLPILENQGWLTGEAGLRLTSAGRKLAALLNGPVRQLEESVSQDQDDPMKSAWLAAWIGDMPLSARLGRDLSMELRKDLELRAARQLDRRAKSIARNPHAEPDINLEALATLGRERSEKAVHAAFRGGDRMMSTHTARYIMEYWRTPQDKELLLKRLDNAGGELFPEIMETIFRIFSPEELNAVRPLLLGKLNQGPRRHDVGAAAMHFLLAPESGLQRLIAGLADADSEFSEVSVCYLALIGTRESLDPLIDRTKGEPNDEAHLAACALACSQDDTARRIADEWFQRNAEFVAKPDWPCGDGDSKTFAVQQDRHNRRGFIAFRIKCFGEKYLPILRRWHTPAS